MVRSLPANNFDDSVTGFITNNQRSFGYGCCSPPWNGALMRWLRALRVYLLAVSVCFWLILFFSLDAQMTGQILAGQAPYQAAAYQIIINFLIAASSVLSVQFVLGFATRATVDKHNHRLMPREGLVHVDESSPRRSACF